MEINDIIRLIEAVSEHGLTSFVLEEDGKKLSMKKEKDTIVTNNTMIPAGGYYPASDAGMAAVNAAAAHAALSGATVNAAAVNAGTVNGISGSGAEAAKGGDLAGSAGISSDKVVVSPLVGTFYDASSPEADSFVQVGDAVKKGQVLGIIEAMKLMNEIESEFDGVIEAVLVKSEEVVEYGQPLFRIR